ncbi:flagellar protein export ATPase FliI [Liquorilactobacillus mali]|uniref:Flagellum-specific ATP synthase n=1 Tax=Liquorilactobacillus mali KCTC 3596 = DSM 20444 TaxID=1046596 RepID=J1F619_9LACO|nr:flagellar protein export ATPase FliI [Liquorilactobacillus mali]AJA34111.1 flagellum-specific ATP synthase [Liquorilactobacillus mali KCTC 3596 = DSM 20444]EJF02198.1 flagellum specific ATP synthase [Liquorilactobacillus mali KCTC 3596 = DSM 20444]KRN11134.1 flagellum specific ATP synthase [Liquorilactobacillus mali KCTC 3596 = DSM 20444]MDC7953973.1 flagellar protein export ATPase FliI [Liquorilactobacillus mali]QFQ75629.1 flagellar protein export ATPase FliI [Liquorilactobacillus mali]
MSFEVPFEHYLDQAKKNDFFSSFGKVSEVVGLTIRVTGIDVFMGEICEIKNKNSEKVTLTEVVGFIKKTVLLMPLDELGGIGPGSLVKATGKSLTIKVGDSLLGHTLDGLGRPMENEEKSDDQLLEYPVMRESPAPFKRRTIDTILSTGVRAIDGMLTVGEGQRMGVFAGSGVGKSTLLGMIAKYCQADVIVIGLIGERGREVKEFIEKDLGDEGYAKSVVVCATSDMPPLVRLKGAYVATAIAEYFRDQGKKVVLMMDSVTRFAMAQREIGLSIGEPPTTKGYTPSVFATLPKLLERSGMSEDGSITAFYTVLVEGDDMNEPIADSVRGILDGHIVLSRKIASKNHYPAISIQDSLSRLMKSLITKEHENDAKELRENITVYADAKDLIDIGAYKNGANPVIDYAVSLHHPIEDFLCQSVDEYETFDETEGKLHQLFDQYNL